jgi:hypothetical protein
MTNATDNPPGPAAEATAAAAAAPAEEAPTGPIEVALATCSSCDNVFLMSGRRETSPCCGADLGVVLATLTIQPDGEISAFWGFRKPETAVDVEGGPAPPAEEPPSPPAGNGEEDEEEEEVTEQESVLVACSSYLHDAGVTELELRTAFIDAGAEREAAASAVGRLNAVRNLLRALREASGPWASTLAERLGAGSPEPEPPRGPAPVAPAPSEDEKTPATSPETPLTSDAGGV